MRRSALRLYPFIALAAGFVACSTSAPPDGFQNDAGEQDGSVQPLPLDPTTGDGSTGPLPSADAGKDSGKKDSGNDATTTTDSGTDSGRDASTDDSGEAGGGDAGTDAQTFRDGGGGPPCSGEGTACIVAGKTGVCLQGGCTACEEPNDDILCTFAYGASGGKYVCRAGSCVLGCRTSATCEAGEICGSFVPGKCGACTDDIQCKGDPRYGADSVCDQNSLRCVPGACSTPNQGCTTNPGDICCTRPGQAVNTCVQGECCSAAQCNAGELCISNMCVPNTCQPVDQTATSVIFHVDPQNGSDSNGTGTPGCKLKSVSRALALIGQVPIRETQILLYDTADATPATGEKFPWILPPTVSLQSTSTGTASKSVKVPINQLGIWIRNAGTRIQGIRMTGDNGGGARGSVGLAVTAGDVLLNRFSIRSFEESAVVITGGTVNVSDLEVDHTHQVTSGSGTARGVNMTGGTLDITGGQSASGMRLNCQSNPVTVPVSCFQMNGGALTIHAVQSSGTSYYTSQLAISGGTLGLEMRGGSLVTESRASLSVQSAKDTDFYLAGGTARILGNLTLNYGDYGLYMRGGTLTVTPVDGTYDRASIGANAINQHAIRIDGNDGPVVLTGVAGNYGSTTFNINSGNTSGIWVNHNVDTGAPLPPLVSITQVAVLGTYSYYGYGFNYRQGDALRVTAGSNVRVRDSDFRYSNQNGLRIVAPPAGKSISLQNIDLGSDLVTNRGGNVFQARVSGGSGREPGVNNGVGICLEIPADRNEQLKALGNFFTDPTNVRQFDCTLPGSAAEVISQKTACTGSGNVRGGIGGEGLRDLDNNPANNNRIDVSRCGISSSSPDGG